MPDNEREKQNEPAPLPENSDAAAADKQDDTEKLDVSQFKDRAEFSSRYHKQKELELAKMQEALEAAKKNKKRQRNWWIRTSLLLVLIIASVVIMFTVTHYVSGSGSKSFTDMIHGIDPLLFIVLIGALLVLMIVESAKYSYLLKVSTGKFRFRVSIKTMFLGRYYDGITPFASGGQPFQVYYLHKKKIPAGPATAIPLTRFIVSTIVWGLVGLVFICISPMFLGSANAAITTTMQVFAWISIVVSLLFPMGVVLISFFPKTGKRIILWLVNLLSKMHIVKRKYAVSRKYVYEIQEYCNSIKLIFSKWWKLIPLVILCFMESIINAALPYFVVIAIADVPPTLELLIQIICLNCISQYAAYLVPTPGNTGAMEATTSLVFITIAGIDSLLGWIVLIWRLTTYYVYILSGIGINVFEIIRGAVRNRRAAKNEQKNI